MAANNKFADSFSTMMYSPNCEFFFLSKVIVTLLRECYRSVMKLLKDGASVLVTGQLSVVSGE